MSIIKIPSTSCPFITGLSLSYSEEFPLELTPYINQSEYINSITDKANFIINAAYVYDAEADNEDSHVLRSDLGPVPNILGDGDGDGVMVDVIGEINQTDRLNFSFGYRYWKLESDNSTTAFGPDFSPKYPGRSLYSERSGLIMGVSYKF